MASSWTCQKCKTKLPRTRQKCDCGRKRPAKQTPAHRACLDVPYEQWVERYGEQCGICGAWPKPGKKLHRDHDHRSGRMRGLLCFPCNRGLPNYVDLDWIDKAAAYLRRS